MNTGRQRTLQFAVGAIALVFMLAAVISSIRLIGEKELIFFSYRRGTWAAAQAEIEYLKLRHAVAQYQAEPDSIEPDDLLLQLDLFWSRLPIILDSEDGEGLRLMPGVPQRLERIRNELPLLETELRALDPLVAESFRTVRDRLEAFRLPLHDLVQQTLIKDNYVYNRERLQQAYVEMLGAFLVVLASGTLLILILLRELRRSRRLHAEARAAEAEVKAAQARMLDAIESVDGAFILLDRNDRIVMANQRYREFYPTVADMVTPGRPYFELVRTALQGNQIRIDPAEQDYLAVRLKRLRDCGVTWEQTLSDGRVLLVNERRTSEGGTVSIRTDITAQKASEDVLRQRLAALENSLDGIAILDAAGTFSYLNDSYAGIHGFDRADELSGRKWKLLYGDEEWKRFRTEVMPCVEAQRRWQGEAVGRRRDGRLFPQELTLSALDNGGLVCIVRDISSRRQAEAERALLQEQFHQAQKLEAIGRLAGGIAHDFNNILAAMMGYASFLTEDLPPGSREHGFATQVLVAGERAKSLVQQILAFGRSQGVDRQDLDMARLIGETVSLMRATLPKNVELSSAIGGRRVSIHANPTQMSQVMMNLCVNAADAIGPEGGSVRVDLDVVEVDGNCAGELAVAGIEVPGVGRLRIAEGGRPGAVRMWVGLLDPGTCLRLTVTDDGTGIPRDVMEHMFEPFYTTKGIGKGTGLGLAAVHGIVTAHRGVIVVETMPGEGTRFEIYLPCSGHCADGAAHPPGPMAAAAGPLEIPERGRILIVDDEAQVSDMLSHALERLGHEVASCADAEEALEVLEEAPDAFDVIITDQMMPGMTGLDLARRIGARAPHLPVILCTGYAVAGIDPESEPNVAAVLNKPVDHGQLAHALSQALGQRPAAASPRTEPRTEPRSETVPA